MSIVYEFDASATCPVDGSIDTYEATLTVNEMVACETINKHVAEFAEMTIYQESLTSALHAALGGKGVLTTVGMHSGVRTTVTVES